MLLFVLVPAVVALGAFYAIAFTQELGPPDVVAVRTINDRVTHGSSAAIDPVEGYAYVLNRTAVVVISGTEVIDTVSLNATRAVEVAPNHGRAYVLHGEEGQGEDRITVLEGTDIQGSIPLRTNAGHFAVLPSNGYAYVTLPEDNQVAVLDGAALRKRIAVDGKPMAVAVDTAKEDIYLACETNRSLAKVQNDQLVLTRSLGITPTAVGVNSGSGYVYVSTLDDTVHVLENDTIVATVPLTGPTDIASDPLTGQTYVLSSYTREIDKLAGWVGIFQGSTLVDVITLGDQKIPNAVEVNPESGFTYVVAGRGSDGIITIITDTLAIQTLPVEQTPWDVAVDATSATGLAYVPIYNQKVFVMGRTEVFKTDPIIDQATTLICVGSNEEQVIINIPAGSIPVDHRPAVVSCSALPEVEVTQPELSWVGQAFRITVQHAGVQIEGLEFTQPLALTVGYRNVDLDGRSPDQLELRLQTGGIGDPLWETDGIQMTARNPGAATIEATIIYAGAYAVLGPQGGGVYLPLVTRNAP
jgi:hypothetical protein